MAAQLPSADGNCLPSHHDDTRGGFTRVDNYDACEDDESRNENGEAAAEEDIALSLNELLYSAHSFHVICLPVSITMILAALAVTYINTPQTIQQGEALMSQAYHVWKVGEDDSTSKQLALDFANGLVIVTVIGTMTFGIVLLYKYRVLIGYMMFSSMTLLGVLGGEVFNVAIEKYRIPIDWFTFVFGIYNFAVVGVTAIFYATGIPTYITQGYLISVPLRYHLDVDAVDHAGAVRSLRRVNALADPCVNAMSEDDSPEMPGLLYEAEIPEGLKRPVMSGRNANGRDGGDDDARDDGSNSPPSSMAADRYQQPSVQPSESEDDAAPGRTASDVSGQSTSVGDVEMSSTMANGEQSSSGGAAEQPETAPAINRNRSDESSAVISGASEQLPAPTAMVPFAIAKLYKLSLTSPPPFAKSSGRSNSGLGRRQRSGQQSGNISTSPLLKADSASDEDHATNPHDEAQSAPYVIPLDGHQYTPAQNRTVVEAILPRNGAKIVKQPRRALQGDREDRHGIIGANGALKRVLFVDRRNGKVYEEMDDDEDGDYEGKFSNTIKLGLGDFIFYSVLVAKSAQYSFPCFISSFLVILAGLGGTLVLLAVYKHALPALPISIFLAVGFYVLVRFVAEPWIHAVMSTPFYV
ncbi:LOW QUALITY PROTEIN: hypothetical protein ACHAXT_001263 [Thalassiosira profunda]